MSRIKELLSELREVTERSRPNTMANDQINLIEAIEHELNKNDLSVETPFAKTEKLEAPVEENESTIESEGETPTSTKRGRKVKQD